MSELLQKPNLETFSEVAAISLGEARVINWPQIEDEKDQQISLELALWKSEEERYKKNIEIELDLQREFNGCLIADHNVLTLKTIEELERLIKKCMRRSCWPYFKPLSLSSEIKNTWKDERTHDRFFKIIKSFILHRDHKPQSYYVDWNLEGIYKAIDTVKKYWADEQLENKMNNWELDRNRKRCPNCGIRMRRNNTCKRC